MPGFSIDRPSLTDPKPFGLLELGSTSLKFYLVRLFNERQHSIETFKFQWQFSHEFFSKGIIGEEIVREIIEKIRRVEEIARGVPLESMLAIATGVFRELKTIDALTERIRAETGIRVRVISGEEEAMLMAKGFRQEGFKGPVILCDLGGGTMEWVWLKDDRTGEWGTLGLGAIRNEYKFQSLKSSAVDYLKVSSTYCDNILKWLPFSGKVDVVATGGTAKALAKHFKKDVVTLEDLRRLIVEILEKGPPEGLKPERRAVFLPGLVILWRLLVRSQATELRYGRNTVRHGMAVRLVKLLKKYPRDKLHATLLLRTQSFRRPSTEG